MSFEDMKNLSEEEQKKLFNQIGEKRYLSKTVNFSCLYGAGPPKISKATGMPLYQAQVLHKAYWERNKAVKQVANSTRKKIVDGQLFLFNPVSRFWYTLRAEKDAFSTLNQGKLCSE